MREIHISKIIDTVKELCIESNYYLSSDIKSALWNQMHAGDAAMQKAETRGKTKKLLYSEE